MMMDDPYHLNSDDVLSAGLAYAISILPNLDTLEQIVQSYRHGLHALQWSECTPQPPLIREVPSNESLQVWRNRAQLFAVRPAHLQHAVSAPLKIFLIRHALAEKMDAQNRQPLQAEAFGPTGKAIYIYEEKHWVDCTSLPSVCRLYS